MNDDNDNDINIDFDDTSGQQQQYLTFMLGEELFALGILSVREIIEHGFVTTVPMAPSFIRGVINLRGAVVPVIDLASRFGRPRAVRGKRTCIVITEVATHDGPQEMGLVVDAVSEVLEIREQDIEPPPEFGNRIRGDFIAGMGNVNGCFVAILDVDQVLSPKEITVSAGLSAEAVAGQA